jgi:cellulose synthase/poly-beta-1,6-N-acetylglucosamine synthase-like glycosyltransferase
MARVKPRSPALFLVTGTLGAIVLVTAQLYYFVKLQLIIGGLTGPAFWLTVAFGTSFLLSCWIAAARYLFMMFCAYFGWARAVRPVRRPVPWPFVSVLVPAFNEGSRIADTLRSILAVDYPNFEVLVVDDGSQDDTLAVATEIAGRDCRVRVFRKPNGGKSSALNTGFRESTGAFVLCVDADSQLEPNALRRMVRLLDDSEVGVVAGQVRVRNRSTLVSKLQALEYALMNGMPRLAQSNFSQVLIAPGPIAMFRRDILLEIWRRWGSRTESAPGAVAGPWESDTFAEDCDVTLNTLLLGKRVIFEPAAISYTTAPVRLIPLLNQRYRWIRGNIQAIRKCLRRWHEMPKAPAALPIWLGIFLVETVAWPAVNVYGLTLFVVLVATVGQIGNLLPWYLILLAIELNAAAFSVRVLGEQPMLMTLTPIFRSAYSVILDINTLCALCAELFRQRMKWA